MDLSKLSVIVTGAAGGLGRCFTKELLRAGASVMAGDNDVDGLEALQKDVARDGAASGAAKLFCMALDVADETSVQKFFEACFKQNPSPNVLINNAGILRDGLLVHADSGWTRKLPIPNWNQALDVNLTGPFLMSREFVARLLEQSVEQSLILNISSISSAGNPGQSNYAASKAGLDACTRTWALELASQGVRVAGIAPGLTDTPMTDMIGPDTLQEIIADIPLKRPGTPEEIWLAVKFAIECDFFTGQVLAVDGGANF